VAHSNPFSRTRQRNPYRRWNTAFRDNPAYARLTRRDQRELDAMVERGEKARTIRAELNRLDLLRRSRERLRAWRRRQLATNAATVARVRRVSHNRPKLSQVNTVNMEARQERLIRGVDDDEKRVNADQYLKALRTEDFSILQYHAAGKSPWPPVWFFYH
jgi:hypothetical protein